MSSPTHDHARAVRRAFGRDPYLHTGMTAVAVRKRGTLRLYAQWRNGKARFASGMRGDPAPVGFALFAEYQNGWWFYRPFYTRAEVRAMRRYLRRRRANLESQAATLEAEAMELRARADRDPSEEAA